MQSKTMSVIEMTTGKILGYVLGVTTQVLILPLYFDVRLPVVQNMQLGLVFMLVASVKSYGVRRFFNWLQWGRKQEYSGPEVEPWDTIKDGDET